MELTVKKLLSMVSLRFSLLPFSGQTSVFMSYSWPYKVPVQTNHDHEPDDGHDSDDDDSTTSDSEDDLGEDDEDREQASMFTEQERELIKFLSLVERGEGMSRAKAEDFLTYIKTFTDERAQLLPKKMKTCWRRVDKVPFHCHYCRDSCLLLYIPLVNYISM